MRHSIWALAAALLACTSAEERARQREEAMIAQARADSAAEADFIADSVALAASVTVDSVVELRVRTVRTPLEGGDHVSAPNHEAVNRFGLVCTLDEERYRTLVRGDTLRCQWGPALP